MSERFDLVIFDCDGVLVDSEPLAARVLAECIQESGIAIEAREVFELFVGGKLADVVQWMEVRLGRAVPESWADDFRRRSFEVFRREVRAVRGVRSVVERLEGRRCVASSGPMEKMRVTLGTAELLPLFEDRVFSAYDLGRWKPEPDLFLHAARTLGVEPARCAVVEDSALGVEAGQRAGMQVFAYAERSDPDRLRAAGGKVFRDMRELPELLGL